MMTLLILPNVDKFEIIKYLMKKEARVLHMEHPKPGYTLSVRASDALEYQKKLHI
jgi:hypothetical protein